MSKNELAWPFSFQHLRVILWYKTGPKNARSLDLVPYQQLMGSKFQCRVVGVNASKKPPHSLVHQIIYRAFKDPFNWHYYDYKSYNMDI